MIILKALGVYSGLVINYPIEHPRWKYDFHSFRYNTWWYIDSHCKLNVFEKEKRETIYGWRIVEASTSNIMEVYNE